MPLNKLSTAKSRRGECCAILISMKLARSGALFVMMATIITAGALVVPHPTAALNTPVSSTVFSRVLTIGSKGVDVSALQQILKIAGFFTYPTITGYFGTVTKSALAAFQKVHNLDPVGYTGPKTRALLNGPHGTSTIMITIPIAPPLSTTAPALPMNSIPLFAVTPGYGGGGGVSNVVSTPAPDTTPPVVSLTSPTASSTVSGVSVTLTATASDNVAVVNVQYKVDGTNIGSAITSSPYTTTWNSASVTDGSHTLYALAEDSSGNYATSSVSVTVDNTPPVISIIATSTVNNTNATVTWTTNEPATSQVNYGTTVSYGSASSSPTLTTSHSIVLTGLTASTTYDFQIQSADGVGNIATSSNKLFTTQTGLIGVDMSGAEFPIINANYAFPSASDWAYLASKGVTFVRLPIAWENIQTTLSSALNSAYLTNLENAISSAHSHGIGVIVDLHNFGCYAQSSAWNSTVYYAGNAGNTGTGVNCFGDSTLTSTVFADLWTRLSTALVGTPGLLGYGLMNEPNGHIASTNLLFAPNGFADNIGVQPWWTTNSPVLSQLATGTNPIAVDGPAWSFTSGTGWGSINQSVTLGSGAYTFSCYAKTNSGTDANFALQVGSAAAKIFTVTTSWQRFASTTTVTAGTAQVVVYLNEGSGHTVNIADCQLEAGSSATAYQPNPYLPYAQDAITAIRAVDASAPIYVQGADGGGAYQWPWANWEMNTLTGGNLVFEAHNYFDGPVSQGGGGGTYSGTYSSYSITSSAGVQEVAPFESWLASTTQNGYVGEYAIPDNSKSDQSSWLPVQNNFLQSLIANNIPSSFWPYANNGTEASAILNIATSTTANHGNDDVRLVQMLQQY